MARQSKKPKKWMLPAVFAAVVGVAIGAYLIVQEATPFRTVRDLDIPSYVENSASLRGNTYKLTGGVDDSLAWSPAAGRLIAVGVDENSRFLPVLFPPKFNSVNLQKGQRFIFLVEVDDKGILKIKDMKKQ